MITTNQLMNINRIRANTESQKQLAMIRSYFLAGDREAIQCILKSDLKKYLNKKWDSQLVTLDDFVSKFLDKVCQVHKKPVLINLKENTSEKEKEKFNALMAETDIYTKLYEISKLTKLHNTILTSVSYHSELDRLWLDTTFNAGTTTILPYTGYELEPKILIRQINFADYDKSKWIVWDRENQSHYYITSEPKIDHGQIINEKYLINEHIYWPFVLYREKDDGYDFFQIGLDSIVDLARTINVLHSLNIRDNTRMSIRILAIMGEITAMIKNKAKNGADFKDNTIEVDMENPINISNKYGGNAGISITEPKLFVDDFIKNIELLTNEISNLWEVDNILSVKLKQDILSGVAIKLRNQPLLKNWAQNIHTLKKPDLELINKIIEVNNFHRPKNQIKTDIIDFIDYQTPDIITNEKEDFELAKSQAEVGVLDWGEWLRRRNPELTIEEAREKIRQNKANNDEFGLPTIEEDYDIRD